MLLLMRLLQIYETAIVNRMMFVERAKVADEKFKKMKDVYNELREKHVGLLRDHANTEKQNKATKKSLDDMERQKNVRTK